MWGLRTIVRRRYYFLMLSVHKYFINYSLVKIFGAKITKTSHEQKRLLRHYLIKNKKTAIFGVDFSKKVVYNMYIGGKKCKKVVNLPSIVAEALL